MNAEQLEAWLDEHEYQPDHFLGTVVRIKDLRALFEGKVLVPVEPTEAMLEAIAEGFPSSLLSYKYMLAASQE
jgi:TATA-box binding protein (TBP) (component of TFIID and TFIIIB)